MQKRKDVSIQQEHDATFRQLTQQVLKELPSKVPSMDDYIAVAYQDSWYPDIIEGTSTQSCTVQFMAASRKEGICFWPDRDDVQNLKREFTLKIALVPECLNSGRLWKIPC